MDIEYLKKKLTELQCIVRDLETAFKNDNRKFTLDGHLLGSIGEMYSKLSYDIELYKPSTKGHDGKLKSNAEVQIKITQGKNIVLSSKPEHLIILSLKNDGEIEEIYNGSGDLVWNLTAAKTKRISLTKIKTLNK